MAPHDNLVARTDSAAGCQSGPAPCDRYRTSRLSSPGAHDWPTGFKLRKRSLCGGQRITMLRLNCTSKQLPFQACGLTCRPGFVRAFAHSFRRISPVEEKPTKHSRWLLKIKQDTFDFMEVSFENPGTIFHRMPADFPSPQCSLVMAKIITASPDGTALWAATQVDDPACVETQKNILRVVYLRHQQRPGPH